jgi:hypothetical protein
VLVDTEMAPGATFRVLVPRARGPGPDEGAWSEVGADVVG